MDIALTITGYFILGCASASFYKAIELVIVKKPEPSNYPLSMLLLCISYIQGSIGLYLAGLMPAIPLPLFTLGVFLFLVAAYLAGPLAFIFYSSLINPLKKPEKIHIAPVAVGAILALWYMYGLSRQTLIAMRIDFISTGHGLILYIIIAGSVLVSVAYSSTILGIELSVRSIKSFKYAVRTLIIITAGLLLSPVALITGFLTGEIGLTALGAAVLGINNTLFIFAHARHRDFFLALGREVRLARYRRSLMKGLDISLLQERLSRLMDEEKYYRNFDISMKSAAAELCITPHQLSYFLNKKLRIDFRNFINRYRVEEAKQLLVENRNQNVLTIGFNVGFGSKTSFNVIFKEFTGKTPTEYRNEHMPV